MFLTNPENTVKALQLPKKEAMELTEMKESWSNRGFEVDHEKLRKRIEACFMK